jgi:hypothetical protein
MLRLGALTTMLNVAVVKAAAASSTVTKNRHPVQVRVGVPDRTPLGERIKPAGSVPPC